MERTMGLLGVTSLDELRHMTVARITGSPIPINTADCDHARLEGGTCAPVPDMRWVKADRRSKRPPKTSKLAKGAKVVELVQDDTVVNACVAVRRHGTKNTTARRICVASSEQGHQVPTQ